MNARLVMAACAAVMLDAAPAAAQPRPAAGQQRPAAAAETLRYLAFVALDAGNILFDAVIKETRRQNRTTAAEVDLCYAPSRTSRRYERATGAMKVAGDQLSGALKEKAGGETAELSYRLRGAGAELKVEGVFRRAGKSYPVAVEGVSVMTPEDFAASQADSTEIVTAFDYEKVVDAGRIVAVMRPDAVGAALGAVAAYPLRVDSYGLLQSCEQMRRDANRVQFSLNPAVAAEAVAKLRATPGVLKAGWEAGSPTESTARIAFGPEAQTGGKVDPAKAAAVIAPLLASALAARQAGATVQDGVTGAYRMTFEKPSDAVPGFGFTETVEASVAILPDPAAPAQAFVEFGAPTYRLRPTTAANIETIDLNGAEDHTPGGSLGETEIARAVAVALKGQVWDGAAEPGRWTPAK